MAQLSSPPITSVTTTTTVPLAPVESVIKSDSFELAVTVIDLTTNQTISPTIEVHSAPPEMTIPELIEKTSRDYDLDPRLALAVAKCENNFKHYNQDGEVLRGRANRYDVGIFQINEQYHLAKSRELGFDIYTPDGNIEYAVWLMKTSGRAPWVWSQPCWSKEV
ncbi:MAG: transglycosylase SLT domain-containing protein [Patescibacteria group bacterium]